MRFAFFCLAFFGPAILAAPARAANILCPEGYGELAACGAVKPNSFYPRAGVCAEGDRFFIALARKDSENLGLAPAQKSETGREVSFAAADPAEQGLALVFPAGLPGDASLRYEYKNGVVAHEFSCAPAHNQVAPPPQRE